MKHIPYTEANNYTGWKRLVKRENANAEIKEVKKDMVVVSAEAFIEIGSHKQVIGTWNGKIGKVNK